MVTSGQKKSGLTEEKLLTENLAVKETLVNSLMLIALVRYKRFTENE